ncbi:MAG: glycoside hydrolase family 32 protein, partial [Planctomycetota bacterium]
MKRTSAVGLALLCAMSAGGGASGMAKEVDAFRRVVKTQDIDTFCKAALALRRWMMEKDPDRPLYHFTGPESWINDPNGVIYHEGAYHLFYQFDPIVDGRRSKRTWGHAVSKDLVHWKDWPVAIWPDSRHDRGGVYSGNMVIDDEGVPTALYTGNVAGHRETYGMLARSTDGFRTWQKKMVMHNDQRPNARSPVHWDAQIWKEGDSWCQLIGGTTGGKRPRGAAFLWTSPDLERWELVKPIHTGGPGRYWELPYLVPLGGKHVLMIGVGGNPYCIGSYDKATMTFTPDGPNWRSADKGDYYSFNPHMVDDKGPEGSARRIMHGWVKTPPSRAKGVPYWQGAHSIPRVITVRDGRLIQEPVPEIQSLRGERMTFRGIALAAGSNRILEGIEGDALEIVATFRGGGTGRFGLKVRASADGKTGVPAWFDTGKREFGAAEKRAASDLGAGRPVRMHVSVDRSVTEVYLNGNAVTKVAYLGSAPRAVAVFAEGGGCRLESIDVWRMKSMWE